MGFRSLRVLNDDIVEPGAGFGEHGHSDMEIISWVLEGALEHQDSTGMKGVLRPGDLQVMTAGRGIRHSEMNASTTDRAKFLQIWIEPAAQGIEPSYGQKSFAAVDRQGRWQLVASSDGRDGSMRMHQDAFMRIADLEPGDRIELDLPAFRYGYVHVAFGSVRTGETTLRAGDALTFGGDTQHDFEALKRSQLLFFDLS